MELHSLAVNTFQIINKNTFYIFYKKFPTNRQKERFECDELLVLGTFGVCGAAGIFLRSIFLGLSKYLTVRIKKSVWIVFLMPMKKIGLQNRN